MSFARVQEAISTTYQAYFAKPLRIAGTTACVISRSIYDGGQGLYGMKQVAEYFHISETPIAYTMQAVTVFGTVSSIFLLKTVPTYLKLSSHDEAETLQPLGWSGFIVDIVLRTAGITYGFLASVNAYFFASLTAESLIEMLQSEPETAAWTEPVVQSFSLLVALCMFYNYYSNDYQYTKRSTHDIGAGIDERHIPRNVNMAITVAAAPLLIYTYATQAFFLAVPSIKGLPYIGSRLGSTAVDMIAGAAATAVGLTVLSWVPPLYRYMPAIRQRLGCQPPVIEELPDDASPDEMQPLIQSESNHSSEDVSITITPAENEDEETPYAIRAYMAAAFLVGVLDSLGSNGLVFFNSTIFTMHELFNVSRYGAIIGLAIISSFNAFIINMCFSVIQGIDKTVSGLKSLSNPDPAPSPLSSISAADMHTAQPSLPSDSSPPAYTAKSMRLVALTFTPPRDPRELPTTPSIERPQAPTNATNANGR